MIRDLSYKDILAYGLFWSWNLIFVAFMVLGFAPRLLPEVLNAVRTGLVPATFLAYGIVLSLVPLGAVALGLTVLRKKPQRLLALGYVVEGPLTLILAIRFFLIRQAAPGFTYVIVVAFLGMGFFLWYLLSPNIEQRGRWVAFTRLFGLTLMLIASLYAAIWIAFYALPLVATALDWLWSTVLAPGDFLRGSSYAIQDMLRQGLVWIPFTVLGILLVLYTATLFAVAPVAVPWLCARAWWLELQALAKRVGWVRPAVAASLAISLSVLFFVISNQQPQKEVFALLERPPRSVDEAIGLLGRDQVIRTGLLNAYLAPFRYMSALGEVRHVRAIYEHVFGMTPVRAYGVQQVYESIARPLLYEPVNTPEYPYVGDNWAFEREPQEAARLYQQFFDTPIVEGERQQIVHAVRSTWSADRATEAWQAVDDREVLLVNQEVRIDEQGDWAEIELYEVYENQTAERQEVVYYFNLPETSVLTGVWLGNSPDRNERFEYQVAPRGAAQAVYRNEVRQNRDPALLEQIGPRQYRLRVFPIPPIGMSFDLDLNRQVVTDAPQLYLWLNYRTLAQEDSWPLPRLAERRNIYWDGSSQRSINGQTFDGELDDWLPESAPATQSVTPQGHRVDFETGESVLATPVNRREMAELELPPDLRLAVVLDRSFSMTPYADEITAALAQLEQLRTHGAQLDVYLTASRFRGEPASRVSLVEVELGEILYIGGQNAAELLAQYAELNDGSEYDAVLVFTDGSGYELGESLVEAPLPEAPLWMVHLGGDIPLGYDDQTLEAIQASGGGVVGDLDSALTRLALKLSDGPVGVDFESLHQDLVDGYLWAVLPTTDLNASSPVSTNLQKHTEEDGFTAIAARQLILAETAGYGASISQLETLDELHALAVEHSVVTPYSSMIVLVDERQELILEHLVTEEDRFEREHEAVSNTSPATEMPLSGVPEPEEWLLIALAVLILGMYAYRKRLAPQIGRY